MPLAISCCQPPNRSAISLTTLITYYASFDSAKHARQNTISHRRSGMHNLFEAKGRITKRRRCWEHETLKAPRGRGMGRGCPPPHPIRESGGGHCELPQWGLGWSPGPKTNLVDSTGVRKPLVSTILLIFKSHFHTGMCKKLTQQTTSS